MEATIDCSILGLYWDNGRENGNYHFARTYVYGPPNKKDAASPPQIYADQKRKQIHKFNDMATTNHRSPGITSGLESFYTGSWQCHLTPLKP